jgi:heterodisulfide reductase subunit B2
MLMTTYEDIALDLNHNLIQAAEDYGAQVIATACPMCQMNLEAYQPKINSKFGSNHKMPIVYFSQLVGLALGIDSKKLGLDTLLVSADNLRAKAKSREMAV